MSINPAQAKLAEIYKLALGVKTMVLMAQGKPMAEDHPHTASNPSPEKTQDQILKAEVMIEMLIEKLDAFAKSFDLPHGWWTSGWSDNEDEAGGNK